MVLKGEKALLSEIKGQSPSPSYATTNLEHLTISSLSVSDDGTFNSIIIISTDNIVSQLVQGYHLQYQPVEKHPRDALVCCRASPI